jgi:hypothetical protein
VFISYSRKDGTEFAAQLRADLSARSLSVWRDIASLEGGRDWWSQIEDAIPYRLLTPVRTGNSKRPSAMSGGRGWLEGRYGSEIVLQNVHS